MSHLQLSDIAAAAIAERRREAQRCEERRAALAVQIAALEEQSEALLQEKEAIERDVQWRQLMAEVQAVPLPAASPEPEDICRDGSIRGVVAGRITHAVEAFRASLGEPVGYAAGAARDRDGALVPYSDTDDYADFTPIDNVVEEMAGEVRDALEAHMAAPPHTSVSSRLRRGSTTGGSALSSAESSATHPSPVSSRGLPREVGASSPACGDFADADLEDPARQEARRGALLKLLALSLYVGRLGEMCGFEDNAELGNLCASEVEDAVAEVAGVWRYALQETGVLSTEECEEWGSIVETFLGPQFDPNA